MHLNQWRTDFLDLFRPWGSDDPGKQHFQLGLSALAGITIGLSVWAALQSHAAVEHAFGPVPSVIIKLQSQSVAAPVGADFGEEVSTAQEPAPAKQLQTTTTTPPAPADVPADAKPFDRYAVLVPAADLTRPGIAFVIVDYGLSAATQTQALTKMPARTTVVAPAGLAPQSAITQARSKNLEVWLGLPLQPADYPMNDAGPLTIFRDADGGANAERLKKALESAQEYAGAATIFPSPILTSGPDMDVVAGTVFDRGLGLLTLPAPDAAALAKTKKAPLATPDLWLDDSAETPEAQLKKAEALAQKQGYAIVLLHPYADSLDLVATWARAAQARGFSLLPLSAIAKRTTPP